MIMKCHPVLTLILLNVLLVSKAREISSTSGQTSTAQVLRQAGNDLNKVIKVISKAETDRGLPKDTALSPGDELIKEELDMLSEDAMKLRKKISRVTEEEADVATGSEDFRDYINGMQSDAAMLNQDTGELIGDAHYDRKQIRTYTDVTFDTDLELLRKETGRVLEDIRHVKPGNISHRKKKTRGNVGKRNKGTIKDVAKAVTNTDHRQIKGGKDIMAADLPNMSPTWRDPRCDYIFDSKTLSDSTVEPAAPALARTRGNIFDVSWLSNYLEACPQCTTSTQGSRCPLTNPVLEMKKWANEIQEILTHGCIKPAGCTYPGTCCIAADVTIEQTIVRVTDMLRDLYEMFHKKCTSCYVQGMLGDWVAWSAWSSCDATCGLAMRSRSRGCKPGAECGGAQRETEPCLGLPDCCVDGGWSTWESWTTCSATCGRGEQLRRRRCSRPAPNYCGKSCVGPRDESRPCNSDKECCVDGNWGRWSSWTACSSSCGESRKTRTRVCNNPPPSMCGRACQGDLQQTEPCFNLVGASENGNWGAWQAWSVCSASCGRGYRNRRRACDSPPPGPCGRQCDGRDTETAACNSERSCCVNGNWGPWQAWSTCSATCDIGNRQRRRSCDNPSPNYCGEKCGGDDLEMAACITGVPCQICVDGNWGTWEPWTQCSVTCGQGTRNRMRLCDNPPANQCGKRCPGRGFEDGICDTRTPCVICIDGNWSPWQSWSQCSVTCGRGVIERRRLCDNPPANDCGQNCMGRHSDMRSCEAGECEVCVNGNWGQWLAWSPCSVTCGRGTNERRRLCDNPPPNYCGQRCPGRDSELGSCETDVPCQVCVNGNWGQWSAWSPCSVTCGRGTNERRRLCDNPPANYCGQRCPGRDSEQGSCETDIPCQVCVNGNWGQWLAWSPCSVTCGRGTNERRRLCDNPPPNYCGQRCPGRDSEPGSCETGVPCQVCVNGNWGQWLAWSPCSVTCGRGTNERRRLCDNPPPNYCGQRCPGRDSEPGSCETGVPCQVCVDGNWGQWLAWSQCSAICGRGRKERLRLCDNPPANNCGKRCPGLAVDSDNCESGVPCNLYGVPCVDGNWGQWLAWSQCSATCGRGTKERRRLCDNPPANDCGKRCPGLDSDTGTCESGVPCEVCVDGNWGQWLAWSQCSATCGRGTKERRRLCDNPPANNCGKRCPGRDVGTGTCESGVPCEVCVDGNWGSWQAWSVCSMTCGSGTRERIRSCDNPPANNCGQVCQGRMFDTDVCDTGVDCVGCVDGNWGVWQPWAGCSVTCGQGTRERQRLCDNPPANYCGKRCPGQDYDTGVCDTGTVCQVCVDGNWGPWQNWAVCSVTCGRGVRERRRSCDNPVANYCGRPCPGQTSDTSSCESGVPCETCVNGNWGSWSLMSSCSTTCGDALIERRRLCDNPPPNYCGSSCVGPAEDIKPERCGPPIIDGQWSSWSSWFSCSVSCGIGSITRSRTCSNPAPNVCGQSCSGLTDERMTCRGAGHCDCELKEWTAWEPYSACSATCGSGVMRRSRTCRVVQPGNDCGLDCPGNSQEETQCVGLPVCLNTWSHWSACSVTCEGRGMRHRFMTNIWIDRRGDTVVERNETRNDTEVCIVTSPKCPVSGWSPWTACSATCKGQGFRERLISTTSGDVGTGDVPVGTDATRKEVENCNVTEPECPLWGQWSACSATCQGRGLRERTISTSTEDVGTGDTPVETDATRREFEACYVDAPACPYGDAAWAAWDSWCPCDCRQGIRTRRRECVKESLIGASSQPVPLALCQGEARDEEFCDTRLECPGCIFRCDDVPPGNYSWCIHCAFYMSCGENQQGVAVACTPANTEWDAFTKSCVTSPSPSCTLHECVSICEGKLDGRYHSCDGCSSYVECTAGLLNKKQCPQNMEWNQHKKRCEAELSPTCIRSSVTRSSILGDPYQWDLASTEDILYHQKDGIRATNNRKPRKHASDDTVKEDIRKDKVYSSSKEKHNLNKKHSKLKPWQENPFETEKQGDSKIPNCRTHCYNAAEGKYPSCLGCEHYVTCTKSGALQERRCTGNRQWDDNVKSCRIVSNTCSNNNRGAG